MATKLKGSKIVEFKFYAPSAKKVSVAGSFNDWSPTQLLAKKDSEGYWLAKVRLKPGRYEYKFFVDGLWQNDPNSSSKVLNAFGTYNSLLEVK